MRNTVINIALPGSSEGSWYQIGIRTGETLSRRLCWPSPKPVQHTQWRTCWLRTGKSNRNYVLIWKPRWDGLLTVFEDLPWHSFKNPLSRLLKPNLKFSFSKNLILNKIVSLDHMKLQFFQIHSNQQSTISYGSSGSYHNRRSVFKFGLSDIQHEPQMPHTRERYRRKMQNVTIEYRVTVE